MRLALSVLLAVPSLASAAPADDAGRLAAILDYVAGDYGGAVSEGRVVDAEEYAEQLEFLEDARAIASRLPRQGPEIAQRITLLLGRVRTYDAAEELGADVRALRRDVIAAWHVPVAPSAPPSLERGKALYSAHCATCHGPTGAADTEAARALTPRPRSFRDPEAMASLTASRAYHAVSAGIEGTAMAAFGTLAEQERWDLAFTVLALRFDPAAAAGARAAAEPAGIGLAELADATDAELEAKLRAKGVADPSQAIQWLRAVAPFADGDPLAHARKLVREALAAFDGGDRTRAADLAREAYVSGFEPREERLRRADAGVAREIEGTLEALRAALASTDAEQVRALAARLDALLDRADAALGAQGS